MATTTNYGWDTPDNSGLVKNGAQDIRTLGSAIDTSLWNIGFGQAGKNRIINGDFGIWQRGTSVTPAINTETYIADRFFTNRNGSGATVTVSQQSFTPGTAPVTGYESQFFYRYAQTVAGTGGSYLIPLAQKIEDVRTFAGQTFTISFWAKADAARVITVEPGQLFGSGGSGAVFFTSQNATLTTSWARYSFTFTAPSVSGKTIGAGSSLTINLLAAVNTAQTLDFWGVQVEYGSKATPFETASGSIQGELALCQRYYYRQTAPQGYSTMGTSQNITTNQSIAQIPLPVSMRAYPTSLDYSTLALQPYSAGSVIAITALVFDTSTGNTNFGSILVTVASGLTAQGVCRVISNNSTSGYLGFSAEL